MRAVHVHRPVLHLGLRERDAAAGARELARSSLSGGEHLEPCDHLLANPHLERIGLAENLIFQRSPQVAQGVLPFELALQLRPRGRRR